MNYIESKKPIKKVNQEDFTINYIKNLNLSNLKNIFDEFGILIIKNLISKSAVEELLESSLYFYKLTSFKLGYKTKEKNKLTDLDYYVKTLESNDRTAA